MPASLTHIIEGERIGMVATQHRPAHRVNLDIGEAACVLTAEARDPGAEFYR